MQSRNAFSRLMALVSAVIFVIGCSSAQPGASGPSPAGAAAPKPGGTARIGLELPPVTLDAHIANDSLSFTVNELVYEGLFRTTPNGPQPMLASKFDVSADGKIWSLKLREGVKFHDGTSFDAAAVKANLERIQKGEKGFPYKGLIAVIEDIKVVDVNTVELRLKGHAPALGSVLGFGPFFMQSPAAMSKHGAEYGGQVGVGTGPFSVASRTPGGDTTLQRNSTYWGEKPLLDGVSFRAVRDAAARVASLESGELDLATGIPATELARLKGDPKLDVRVVGTPRQAMLRVNGLKAPLSNKLFRQALMYGTDRPSYIEQLLKGVGEPSDSLVGTGVFGYAAQKPYPYDPTKAKALLTQAGVAEGTTFELVTIPQFETHAAAIAQDLARIGLKINIVKYDLNALIEYQSRPAERSVYQLIFATRTSQYGDAEFPIVTDFHSDNWTPKGANASFYKNPAVDALLDQTKSEVDRSKRASQFAQALAILWEDLPEIPIYRVGFAVATSKALQSVEITPYERIRLEKAWLNR